MISFGHVYIFFVYCNHRVIKFDVKPDFCFCNIRIDGLPSLTLALFLTKVVHYYFKNVIQLIDC